MTAVAILVPVLDRPERVVPVLESARETAPDARIVFVASPGDARELHALEAAGADTVVVGWRPGPGDYARKLNHAFAFVTGRLPDPPWPYDPPAEWVFLGADDLTFTAGWLERCLHRHVVTRACVIGTNDLGNDRVMQGVHSTHTLVNAAYWACGTADEDEKLLHEGYTHQYVDDEFVQTAWARGTFAAATDAIVEHLHPDWGKAPDDETYRRARAHVHDDRAYFEYRCHLWKRRRP